MPGTELKIDRKNIPPWASWIAQDLDGSWWAFEHEPNEGAISWYENEVGQSALLLKESDNPDWRGSLRKISTE